MWPWGNTASMTRETKLEDTDTYTVGGRTYRASADYVASFVAHLGLHALRFEDRTFPLEMVASGLDEHDVELLR